MSKKLYEETDIQNIANSIRGKNGETTTYKVSEMATAITNIPSGGVTPTGTIEITENGTVDVTEYASANVSVPTKVYVPREVDENGKLLITNTSGTRWVLPSDVHDLGKRVLSYTNYQNTATTEVDLSSLTQLSGDDPLTYAFTGNTALTTVDISNLQSMTGANSLYYTFSNCTGLTSVDFSSLTTLSGGYALNYTFQSCTALTDIYFRALTTSSFGSYTNQLQYMLTSTGSTVVHTLHFPSNMESTISALDGYPTFGGTSGYITLSYDLPATS